MFVRKHKKSFQLPLHDPQDIGFEKSAAVLVSVVVSVGIPVSRSEARESGDKNRSEKRLFGKESSL